MDGEHDPGDEKTGGDQPPMPPIKAEGDPPRPPDETPQPPQEPDHAKRVADWTRYLTIVTGALVFVGVCQFGAGFLQWRSMQGQLSAMHDADSGAAAQLSAAQQLASDTQNLATAASDQANAAGAQASSMRSLASTASDQMDELQHQVSATQAAAGAAQTQAKVSEGQLRPWVTIEPVYTGMLRWYGENGFLFSQHKVKNVGHSPAFNVQVRAFSFFPSESNPNGATFEKRSCDPIRKQPFIDPGWGVTLFPGEENDNPEGAHLFFGPGITPDDVRLYGHQESGLKKIGVWVVGCVDYVFGSPPVHHQTGYVYELAHRIHRPGMVDAMSYEFTVGENVQAEDLIVERPQSSSVNTD